MLIDNQHQLEEYCKKWRASGQPLSFDTEFVSDKRYFPLLCLVQVGVGDERLEGAVDPFKVDLKPLLEMIADPTIEKIVHAGSADLQILATQFNCEAHNVFDTQIAAAFLGYGQQIGYTDLVKAAINAHSFPKIGNSAIGQRGHFRRCNWNMPCAMCAFCQPSRRLWKPN